MLTLMSKSYYNRKTPRRRTFGIRKRAPLKGERTVSPTGDFAPISGSLIPVLLLLRNQREVIFEGKLFLKEAKA